MLNQNLVPFLRARQRCVRSRPAGHDVPPLLARIEAVSGESDLEEVYNTERHLLYVITSVAPASELLADLAAGAQENTADLARGAS
ncbi:MAG: hypothetical protein ACRD4H_10060 [Candidatus Acidiferrales bacterium]